jgi:RNA polymerase sigma factor (sigma-70 family)
MTDSQRLIAEYVERGSEAAFRELVARYLDLVHSAALRLVGGDVHLAEDVSQTVFSHLARTARSLPDNLMLGGWLHRHTCFVAAKLMRGERRRQSRERQAVEMNALDNDADRSFPRLAPLLDEAINELAEPERTAILLRFFEQQDFRQLGETIGSSQDAARMRVNRALEKLETLLKRRGITSTAAALSVALAAGSVQAAPAGLAAAIAVDALAETALATSSAVALTKTIAMTTLQKTIIGATLAVAVGTGIFEARRNSELRREVQMLQEQQASITKEVQQLTQGQEDSKAQLAVLLAKPPPAPTNAVAAAPVNVNPKMIPSNMVEAEIERAFAEPRRGRREAALQRLSRSIAPEDLPRALAFLAQRPGTNGVQSPLFNELANQWGAKDPDAAINWAYGLADTNTQKDAVVGVLKGWTHPNPEAAAAYAAALPAGPLQEAGVMQVVHEWSFWDSGGAADWIGQFPPGDLRNKALDPLFFWGNGQCPAALAELLDTFADPELYKKYGENMAQVWLARDETAARAWIADAPLADDVKQRLLKKDN